jgi:uncharacterized protein YkwD
VSLTRSRSDRPRRKSRSDLCALAFLIVSFTAAAPTDPLDPMRAAILARLNHRRPESKPLSLSPALSRVAQARAEELARSGRNPRQPPLPEAEAAAKKEGYEPRLLGEVFIAAEGSLDAVLDESLRGESALTQEISRVPYTDLGIGVAQHGDEPPHYVFLFAASWADFLKEKRAELSDLSRVRRELLERINRERTQRHLAPLRADPRLDVAAQRHADDMLARSYYGHKSPEGKTALERSKSAGYVPQFVGENIAEGQDSYDRVVKDWMASAVHREHILSPVFSDIGSGVAVGANKSGNEILWVQVFGRSK